jgi:hypothetical protein
VCACTSLTVHRHPNGDALLEAAELALVAGDLVDDAAAFVLAGVGGVQVLLDGPAEEALRRQEGSHINRPSRKMRRFFVIVAAKDPSLCGTFSYKCDEICGIFMQFYAMKLREPAIIAGTWEEMRELAKNAGFR